MFHCPQRRASRERIAYVASSITNTTQDRLIFGPGRDGPMQRGPPAGDVAADVGAVLEEQRHYRFVTVYCCPQKRGTKELVVGAVRIAPERKCVMCLRGEASLRGE